MDYFPNETEHDEAVDLLATRKLPDKDREALEALVLSFYQDEACEVPTAIDTLNRLMKRSTPPASAIEKALGLPVGRSLDHGTGANKFRLTHTDAGVSWTQTIPH